MKYRLLILGTLFFSFCVESFGQKDFKHSIGVDLGWDFPGFKSTVNKDGMESARFFNNFQKSYSWGLSLYTFTDRKFNPEVVYSHHIYADWQGPSDFNLYNNTSASIDFFMLNGHKELYSSYEKGLNISVYAGLNYGMVNFIIPDEFYGDYNTSGEDQERKANSMGIQYGSVLQYDFGNNYSFLLRIQGLHSISSSVYILEKHEFTLDVHAGLALKFGRIKDLYQ